MRGIYYGWYVLAVATAAGILCGGSSQMFLGAMLPAITADTGWSHSAISGGIALGTLAGGVFAPVAGVLVDRYGPRLLLPAAALVLSIGYALLGASASLWMFYVSYVLVRLSAQGTLGGAILRSIPVQWFRRRRGRAMGFVTMSVPLGAAIAATASQLSIDAGVSWRLACTVMGVATFVLLVVPGWLILRKSPEAIGLLPDGVPAAAQLDAAVGPRTTTGHDPHYRWSAKEAFATGSLRLLVTASVLGIGANGAMIFYHVTFLLHRGLTSMMAVIAVSTLALAGALANVVWGFMSERYDERLLASGSQAVAAVLICGLFFVDDFASAMILAVLLGFSIRGESSLVSLIVAKYFGRWAFGTISGFMTSMQLVGLGLGPLVAALLYEATHSYLALYAAIALVYVATAVLFASARPPITPRPTI